MTTLLVAVAMALLLEPPFLPFAMHLLQDAFPPYLQLVEVGLMCVVVSLKGGTSTPWIPTGCPVWQL